MLDLFLFTTDSFIPTSPFNFHLSLAYTPFGGKLDTAASASGDVGGSGERTGDAVRGVDRERICC
jgi:hypothetical protein